MTFFQLVSDLLSLFLSQSNLDRVSINSVIFCNYPQLPCKTLNDSSWSPTLGGPSGLSGKLSAILLVSIVTISNHLHSSQISSPASQPQLYSLSVTNPTSALISEIKYRLLDRNSLHLHRLPPRAAVFRLRSGTVGKCLSSYQKAKGNPSNCVPGQGCPIELPVVMEMVCICAVHFSSD